MITNKNNPLHIRNGVYRTAGRQYGWLRDYGIAGIGIAMSVLNEHAAAGSQSVYVRIGKTPYVYAISMDAIRDVYSKYKPVQTIRGTTIVVVPVQLCKRIDVADDAFLLSCKSCKS